MSDEEDRATQFIVQLLRKVGRPLTTQEIEEMADEKVLAYLMLCPDETIGFLRELKTKGLIEGKFSAHRKSWIWWVK